MNTAKRMLTMRFPDGHTGPEAAFSFGGATEVNMAAQLTPEQIEKWREKALKLQPTPNGSIYVKPQDLDWAALAVPGNPDQGALQGRRGRAR